MASPVTNSIVKDWSTQSTVPAGYPKVPEYQPASAQAQNPCTGAASPYSTQQGVDYSGQPVYGITQAGAEGYPVSSNYEEQMVLHEAMMNAPAASAADRGMMTYDDAVVRSLIRFGLLLTGATVGWLTGIVTLGVAILVALDACMMMLGLDLFIRSLKTVRPATIIVYSLIEGFVLSVLSFAFELMYPGIVVTAVVATLVVIGVTLAIFTMSSVCNSSTLARAAGIGCTMFFFYYMTSFVLSVTGPVDMTAVSDAKVFDIPLGIIIGILAVFIDVLCPVRDFGTVKVDVVSNVPEKYSWLCIFAIMTNVIRIYLEILRTLSYPMRRDRCVTSPALRKDIMENTSVADEFGRKPTLSFDGTPSNELVVEVLHGGNGQVIEAGDTITCYYYGAVFGFDVGFDSSFDCGGTLSFQISAGMVIPGWDEGPMGR